MDLTGKFRRALNEAAKSISTYNINGVRFTKRRFDRVEITKDGKVISLPSRIYPMNRTGMWWSVSQPTGSGKTILGIYDIYKTYQRGGKIAGNLSYQHFEKNEGLPPEQWKPSIMTMEDLQGIKRCHCIIDDIKGTIERWQGKEADVVTLTSNTGRKEGVDLTITTQRVINYIPPNIRAVATGYELPYITIRDCRKESPDGKGFPIEMEVFSLIPGDSGDIFIGFGCLHGDIADGMIIRPTKALLESYRTMELATGLKVNDSNTTEQEPDKEPYLGYNNEIKVINDLKLYKGTIRHLSAEHPQEHSTDILFQSGKNLWDIDVVSCRKHGGYYELQTSHKDLTKFNENDGTKLIAFTWKEDLVRYININHLLGKDGDIRLSKDLRMKMSSGDKLFEKL